MKSFNDIFCEYRDSRGYKFFDSYDELSLKNLSYLKLYGVNTHDDVWQKIVNSIVIILLIASISI